MLLQAFNWAIVVAKNVDHNRLADDAAYRQRVVDMLQCEKPAGPSLTSRIAAYLTKILPKAA
jgi:hypothetical protein